jgi:chloride channel protein, CIC family
LPDGGTGFWPLISMGAVMGGTMRSPFTGVIFVLELTHDMNVLLPLLVATTVAHAFTVLVMRRSILTEKLSRRGFHLSREYEVDPLEVLSVEEVMGSAATHALAREAALARAAESAASPLHDHDPDSADPDIAYTDETLRTVVYRMADRMAEKRCTELPVEERERPGQPVGVITLHDLLQARIRNLEEETVRERLLQVYPSTPKSVP